MFKKTGYKARVYESFILSPQYTPMDFWNEYKDSMLLILKEEDILEFNMVYSGNVDISGNIINISCEDDAVYRSREEKLIKTITGVFQSKALFEVSVNIKYTEPVSMDKFPATGTYGIAEIYYKGSTIKNTFTKPAVSGKGFNKSISDDFMNKPVSMTNNVNNGEDSYYANMGGASLASEMFNKDNGFKDKNIKQDNVKKNNAKDKNNNTAAR